MGLLLSSRPQPVKGVQFSGLGSMVRDSLQGVQLSGLFNAATDASSGVQVGGVLNAVNASLEGYQVGGVVNTMKGDLKGGQFGGVANQTGQSVRGVQAGGVVNRVGGAFSGVQAAGVVNMNAQSMQGVQLGGVMNYAQETSGVQAAGVYNRSRSMKGLQMAGVLNMAEGPMRGVQLSVVNLSGRTKGVQVGLVNLSASNSGLPIGFVSYVKDVGLRYEVWTDEMGRITVAQRSGTRRFSNYIGYSVRTDETSHTPAVVLGFGGNFQLQPRLSAMVDGLYNIIGFEDTTEQIVNARFVLAYHMTPRISIMAGPSLNLLMADTDDHGFAIPWSIESGTWGTTHYTVWAGFSAGLRVATKR